MSSLTRPLPRARAVPRRPSADAMAVAAFLVLTVAAAWDLLRPGAVTVGLDAVAFFYPMYSFLGERLRAGDVPGWNPSQFSGAPFAADPESGWTYLPAMLTFALLPLAAAAKAFALVHLLLAGLGAYLLARALRIGPIGALVAAVAFAHGGFFSDRLRCCFVHVQVAAWLPWLLLGAEWAARSRRSPTRLAAWSLGGFALSQILAGWLGQGASYALLALGAYLLYRVVLDPPNRRVPLARRLRALPLHGGAIGLIGFALAATGILPRLAYLARSNLAAGYAGTPELAWAADLGGWGWRQGAALLLDRTGWYVGGATLGLALAAPILAGRRHAVPGLAALLLAALALTLEPPTPLRTALYALLPRFRDVHEHRPERVLVIAYLALALLAGASVGAMTRWRPRRGRLLDVALPAVVALGLVAADVPISRPALGGLVATAAGLAAVARLPCTAARVVPPLLALLVAADLQTGARRNVARGLYDAVDLAAYDDPGGADAFLRPRAGAPPPRFFGYDPALRSRHDGQTMPYRHEYRDPRTRALLVNNRATLLRLADLQGYNPIQPERYVELVATLNGHPQEYHGAYVFPAGLDSPLLDLLGVRYVLLPARVPPTRGDLARLLARHETVFRDGATRVLERRTALPRAWIVHEASRVERGDALPLLAAGAVDPRRVALLENDPPPLAAPPDAARDEATIVAAEPDRLRLRARTDAAGLLMLGEGYDPGWRAEVDGRPAPVLVADHALRAVPLPPGEHSVELRYEPPGLRLGLAISAGGAIGLAIALGWSWWPSLRRRRGRDASTPSNTAPPRRPSPRRVPSATMRLAARQIPARRRAHPRKETR